MSKEKLTLYMDKKTSRMAHQASATLGKSISELVREFTVRLHREIESGHISPEVSRWIGVLRTRKSYKSLREEHIESQSKRYEDLD